MANYGIKVDLLKVKGAFMTNIKGRTATKKCLCIPVEDGGVFLGEKGCYLSASAFEMQKPQYGDTHLVKLSFDKTILDQMTEEQRKAIPIIGGMREIKSEPMAVTETVEVESVNDLPF